MLEKGITHDVDDSTHVGRTTAAGFLAGHTRTCLIWQEIEKTDGSHGMHRFAVHWQTRSRSDIHATSDH